MNKMFEIALSQYGIKEWAGSDNNNPEVMKYFTESGFVHVENDELSWCSAFMCWIAKQANLPHTNSLMARSWLKWGEQVITPQIGDITVLWRIAKSSIYGHVGMYVRHNGSNIWVLGGNQSNQVMISPYSGAQLLGFRRL